MINLLESHSGVYYVDAEIAKIQNEEIEFLKFASKKNPRGRVRICAHREYDDKIHEMIIAIINSSYIRIHKHINKCESFHIIEGIVDVIHFDNFGEITNIVRLGARETGYPFYYRIKKNIYHTLNIQTEYLVMHEVTSGPFAPDQTIYADFSPSEDDSQSNIDVFKINLNSKIKLFTQ